jgi:hypothetical protein
MLELTLAGISLLLAVLALGYALRLRKRFSELQAAQQGLLAQLQLQQQSISGLTAGAVGMDRRLRRSEATEKVLTERQQTIENQQTAEQPYGHAIRLVQQGASVQRLVEELALSESEADLIVRLHSLRETA